LILDLSIPKNVHADVEELEGVLNSHGLFSQLTDETLENRKIISQLLKLLSKKSKRSLMFGPKEENLLQQFML
jgi:hypothetical protein